ncbi:MAG: hemin-degrading factor [Paracoccaceae bacterium]|nr:MAG: hemin-degrading factor [Paracoccaceae bacterium]
MLLSPDLIDQISNARAQRGNLRERDLAAAIGLTEAHLVAAEVGQGAVRIAADPTRLMPLVAGLGDVMALTRNESCVHERRGSYLDFHAGDHAAMVLGPDIDLRIFPRHWVHAFAVTKDTKDGPRRSIQVFDAAGDAVHKVHLGAESDIAAFDRLALALALPGDTPFILTDRAPVDGPRANPDRADDLREAWSKMTDTHQFQTLVHRLKMNRLGAYRVAGEPFVRPLPADAVETALRQAAAQALPIMIFVGNRGCIQIHSGPVARLEPMGPWFNVLDPRFNLHLRADRIAEVLLVTKPTKRGPAISVEAFDAGGELILQIFGKRTEAATDTAAWDRLATGLAMAEVAR